MITIKYKTDCCGCGACVQICPKQCIDMQEDEEGFYYPNISLDVCINCGRCERVCPVINQEKERKPFYVYAAKCEDEIRKNSYSGGVFPLLSKQIIDEGGIVFGARFDENWNVVHDYADSLEKIAAFGGSKYVQSQIGDSYQKVESFLRCGYKVLFSGTPCQVAGLKRYLQKEYENLLTVDIICHGVPSPLVWKRYLEELLLQFNKAHPNISETEGVTLQCIDNIEFRNKKNGWKKYCFVCDILCVDKTEKTKISYSIPFDKNVYMRGFLNDLYLRPSCYQCPSKSLRSGSDITLGDYWGIHYLSPAFDDDLGVSCVLVNTKIGEKILENMNGKLDKFPSEYSMIVKYNPSVVISARKPIKRSKYFNDFSRKGMVKATTSFLRPTFGYILRRSGIWICDVCGIGNYLRLIKQNIIK